MWCGVLMTKRPLAAVAADYNASVPSDVQRVGCSHLPCSHFPFHCADECMSPHGVDVMPIERSELLQKLRTPRTSYRAIRHNHIDLTRPLY